MVVSYSDGLASGLAQDFRRLVQAPWYAKVFPLTQWVQMKSKQSTTSDGGYRLALSVGGSLTGKGADYIIVDDPLKASEAYSDNARENVNTWFGETLYSRLDDKSRSALVIVMQRLHANGLCGSLQKNTQAFDVLSLPAIATYEEEIPIGKEETHTRYVGDVLHPEHESREALQELRVHMGSKAYAAQYQQQPEAPEGELFKTKWIQRVAYMPVQPENGAWVISVDTAYSLKDTADYSVIMTALVCEDGVYIWSVQRGRWTYEELKARVFATRRQLNTGLFTTNACRDVFARDRNTRILWSTADESKEARAYQVLNTVELGLVHVVDTPQNQAWIKAFLYELSRFPYAKHDDQVDAFVYLLLVDRHRYYCKQQKMMQELSQKLCHTFEALHG